MRYLLLSVLICLQSIAIAQNYKGVVSTDTTYYLSAGDDINEGYGVTDLLRAIWVVDKSQIGADSLFTFFHSIRPYYPITYIGCLDTIGPSWMGPKMIRKSTGDELYYNFRNDEITISTNAQINDTWKITTDTTGIEYWGTVTSITADTLDGQLDSIKQISLQAFQGSTPINHDYNTRKIRLSKEHGFVDVFSWYSFPYFYVPKNSFPTDSSLHHRIQRAITEIDLYKIDFNTMFQPGTYWQIRDSSYQYFLKLYDRHIQDSVINLNVISPDTAYVEFARIRLTHEDRVIAPPSMQNPNGIFLDTIYIENYTYIDTIVSMNYKKTIRNSGLPEHYETYNSNPFNTTVKNADRIRFHTLGPNMYLYANYFNSNLYPNFWSSSQYNCFVLGGGVSGNKKGREGYIRQMDFTALNYYSFTGMGSLEYDIYRYMYFYHDANIDYGSPLNLKTLSAESITTSKNNIQISPNPSQTGIFTIKSSNELYWEIFDLRGQKILSGKSFLIDLHDKVDGLYLVRFIDKDKSYFTKIVKESH